MKPQNKKISPKGLTYAKIEISKNGEAETMFRGIENQDDSDKVLKVIKWKSSTKNRSKRPNG
jgi:hypothetical protein